MNGSFISQSTFRFKRSVCVCLYSFSLSFSSILFPFLSEIENKNGKIAQKSWNSIVYCTLSTLSCCTTIVKTYSSPNIFIGNSKWVAYALVFCVVFVPNYFSGACFFCCRTTSTSRACLFEVYIFMLLLYSFVRCLVFRFLFVFRLCFFGMFVSFGVLATFFVFSKKKRIPFARF